MTDKITLELNPRQVEELAGKLPMQEKVKLAAQLDKETWDIRFDDLIRKIRQRAKKSTISEKEITQACQRTHTRLYYGEN